MLMPMRFTAFLLPGQFTPWSKSSNRNWPIRFLELLLPGPFALRSQMALELSFSRLFDPWNFRSLLIHDIDLRHDTHFICTPCYACVVMILLLMQHCLIKCCYMTANIYLINAESCCFRYCVVGC